MRPFTSIKIRSCLGRPRGFIVLFQFFFFPFVCSGRYVCIARCTPTVAGLLEGKTTRAIPPPLTPAPLSGPQTRPTQLACRSGLRRGRCDVWSRRPRRTQRAAPTTRRCILPCVSSTPCAAAWRALRLRRIVPVLRGRLALPHRAQAQLGRLGPPPLLANTAAAAAPLRPSPRQFSRSTHMCGPVPPAPSAVTERRTHGLQLPPLSVDLPRRLALHRQMRLRPRQPPPGRRRPRRRRGSARTRPRRAASSPARRQQVTLGRRTPFIAPNSDKRGIAKRLSPLAWMNTTTWRLRPSKAAKTPRVCHYLRKCRRKRLPLLPAPAPRHDGR
jgi:hypothetical protein